MKGIKDPSHLLDVDKQAYHLARPGFRIAELTINPTQRGLGTVTQTSKTPFTFWRDKYVFSCATPRRRCASRRAKPMPSGPSARTLLSTAVSPRRPSWFCKVSANTTSFHSRDSTRDLSVGQVPSPQTRLSTQTESVPSIRSRLPLAI